MIRRVGAHAGQLKPVEKEWSPQSNIYLRATGVTPDALKERFARLDMSKYARNGVGGGSINMSEIVELYGASLEEDMQREVTAPSIEMLRRIALAISASDEALSSEKVGSLVQQPIVPKPTIGDRESRATQGDAALGSGDTALPDPLLTQSIRTDTPTRDAVARLHQISAPHRSISIAALPSLRRMRLLNRLDQSLHLVAGSDATLQQGGDRRAEQPALRRSAPRRSHEAPAGCRAGTRASRLT